MPRFRVTLRQEAGGELPEGHVGRWFGNMVALQIEFLFEALFDGLGSPAVAGAGRLRVTDAVHGDVAPPDAAPLKEAHGVIPRFCCCRSSQRMI